MKKTLIIVAHPNLERSVVNSKWLEKLKAYPELYTVHDIYEAYPDEKIDVEAEQKLVENHDHIVFQFPLFWFSSPPLLKKWQDLVLTYGWAYGSSGNALINKRFSLAVAAGIWEEDYQPSGRYIYTMNEILKPFEMTVNYIKAHYLSPFIFYGTEPISDTKKRSNEEIIQSAEDYHQHLQALNKSL